MMFTCVTPGCADPRHGHRAALAARRGAGKALRTKGASAPGKIVRDRKGRSLRVDIHCHYLNRDAAAKLAHLNPAQHEPSFKFASALTRKSSPPGPTASSVWAPCRCRTSSWP